MLIDAHAHIFPAIRGHIAAGKTRQLSYGRIAIGDEVTQALPPLLRKTAFGPDMLLARILAQNAAEMYFNEVWQPVDTTERR